MGIHHHETAQIHPHTIKQRTGCRSIPASLDSAKQATDWCWQWTCCAGDCPRTTAVRVVLNKRQTTSPVDVVPSTDHLRESMASLFWTMRREHGSRTMLWTYEWCVMAHARRRRRPATGTGPVNFGRCERYTNEWNGTGTGPEREPEQV